MADKPKALPYVFDAPVAQPATAPTAAPTAANELLDMEVDNLELSIRTANCLQNADITFIGELVRMTEADLLRTKNAGRKSLAELNELLGEMGLRLGMDVGGWQPPG
jgi:DNA-directed RNA polymerase subunit alpha